MTTLRRVPVWPALAAASVVFACRAATAPAAERASVDPDPPSAAIAPVDPAPPSSAEPADAFTRLLAGMGVRFFERERKLEVGGWVNMQAGLVEVFACAPDGKTHEAVVVLDCVPSGLHAGLLALGLEPGTPVEIGTGADYRPPTGDRVLVEVRWIDAGGREHVAAAEDWVWDQTRQQPMERGWWIFAGSFLQPVSGASDRVTFAADYVKSLVTTYHDASSILENPLPEGIDDTVYYSNERAVPPAGTPIVAVFRCP